MNRNIFLVIIILFVSCKTKQRAEMAFYYWKTRFSLSTNEKNTLTDNNVQKLYARYFDIDKETPRSPAKPISPIVLDPAIKSYAVIPVIFIKNRVFINLDRIYADSLAANISSLIDQINKTQQLKTTEVQFDCDWTDQTQRAYFSFINAYRKLTGQYITATIRLHQVKYFAKTGIPPVDHGVLMYYNMGEINSSYINSIYDKNNASRYNASISGYPLSLDIALPIFCWGQQIRNNKVTALLNKLNASYFKKDSNFVFVTNSRISVKHSSFKAGYYFIEGDEIKLETITEEDLISMSSTINKFFKKGFRQVIFYDLDSINLAQYDKNIYQKVLDNIN